MLGQVYTYTLAEAVRFPRFKRLIVRRWYEFFNRLDRDGLVQFMNYGYVPADGTVVKLETADEPDRLQIQLYHEVATQVDLRELDVLEVGSGRGGGASYVTRYLRPRSYIGLDISRQAVAFCRKHYQIPGLAFVEGDAEAISFPDESFDAVINIESSGHYGDLSQFLAGVRRVLRPGGYLVYADIWRAVEIPSLFGTFARAGLRLHRSRDLRRGVVAALDADEARKQQLMQRYAPHWVYGAMREFIAAKGSHKYQMFAAGDLVYVCCLLCKEISREGQVARGEHVELPVHLRRGESPACAFTADPSAEAVPEFPG